MAASFIGTNFNPLNDLPQQMLEVHVREKRELTDLNFDFKKGAFCALWTQADTPIVCPDRDKIKQVRGTREINPEYAFTMVKIINYILKHNLKGRSPYEIRTSRQIIVDPSMLGLSEEDFLQTLNALDLFHN